MASAMDVFHDDREKQVVCDCDFHTGRWQNLAAPKFHFWGDSDYSTDPLYQKLKYAKEGDPLVSPHYCNHPSKSSKNYDANTKTGYQCSGYCKEYNDYAMANQKDGTYICYNCRPPK